jgi:hypothetical protein
VRNKRKTVAQNDRDLVDAVLLYITTVTLTLQVSVLCPKIFLRFSLSYPAASNRPRFTDFTLRPAFDFK